VRAAEPILLAAVLFARGLAGGDSGQQIYLKDGYAFVSALVNGQGPFRLLIDTGAASCILTPDAARKAGLAFDHRVVLVTLGGEKTIPSAWNNTVQVGDRAESGVEIVVTEAPQLRKLDRRADGVLGQSFLSRSAFLVDFAQEKFWLGGEAVQRAGRLPIKVTASRAEGRTVLPVVLDPGTKPWRLTLDSGASHLMVQCAARCPRATDIRLGARILTYVGEQPASQGKLRRVEIGGVAIWFTDVVFLETSPPDDQDEGVLPAQWFSAIFVDGDVVRLAPRASGSF